MATAASSQAPLLDLAFLTEEERAQIEAVLRADEELRVRDRVRIGTLRQNLERERYHQKQLVDQRQCTHCEKRLGIVFNSGAHCPGCLFRVCKECRVKSANPPPPFLCSVCVKKRLLDLQAADYMPISQSILSTPLYGSELVLKSLQAANKNQPQVRNPYDGNPQRRISNLSKPRSSTATTNSSIIVQYVEMEKSGEALIDEDVKREEEVGNNRERPASLFARKLLQSEMSESEEEEEEEDEAKAGLTVPGRLKHSDSQSSIGSLASMYSAPGGKGDYQITGKVHFGVWYSREGILKIHVNQAKGLAATRKEGYSYPYVKVYLLPDRSKTTKRKTGFVRRTVEPKYDETLKYKMPQTELTSRTLWLSVWDWDRFGRNQFLGEVRLPLGQLDLTNNTDRWYPLQEMDEAANQETEVQYRGRLKVGLKYEWEEEDTLAPGRRRRRRKGALHVAIKQAEDLPKMDSLGLTDAAVKCYLLPHRTSSSKRKTTVAKNTVDPVWDEEFVYKCSLKELTNRRVLEVTVWDFDKRGSNEFIGGLHLGPAPGQLPHPKEWMDSFGVEVSHWEAMLSRPGEWVEQWHTLRPKMDHVTSLPQKPAAMGRELSPVQEKSPPVETEEGAGERGSSSAPQREASPVPQVSVTPPTTPVQRGRSLSLGKPHPAEPSVATPQATPSNLPQRARAVSLPQATPKAPSTAPPHDLPLSQVAPILEKQQPMSPPSPVPELLVTPDSPVKPRSSTFGSQISLYSVGEMGKGSYDITGEVLMSVQYKEGQLLVYIDRARNLAAADSNGFSDPYVKTYLLPDKSKHSKRKTDVQKKTLNPMYSQTLKYTVPQSELSSRTLWVSVWDWDRFGRNQFLGEFRLPLKSLNLQDSTEIWYSLQDKHESSPPPNPNRGELELALKFVPKETTRGVTSGNLSVLVKRASNLSSPEGSEKPDPFVKLYLLPEKSTSGRRKTSIIKNSSSPSWEERLIFEKVTLEEVVKERVLEVTVWDHGEGGSNEFIGGLRIGPAPGQSSHPKEWMDSSGVEVTHWEAMLSCPGEWAEQWHTLRRSMEPLKIKPSTSHKDSSAAAEGSSLEDEFRKVVTKPGVEGAKESKTHQGTGADAKGFPVTSVRSHRSALPPGPSSPINEDEPPSQLRRSSPVITQAPIKRTMSPLLDSVQASKSKKTAKTEPAPSPPSSPPHRTVESPITSVRSFPSKSSVPSSSPLPTNESVVSKPQPPFISEDILPREQPSHQPPPAAGPKRTGLLGLAHGDSQQSFGSQLSIYSAAGGGKGNYDITGEVLMGVHYREGQLLVHIRKARNLAAADSNGFSDPYVKTYLLPDKSKHSKRKTDIQRKTLNPVYNQTLVYKIPRSELSSRTLWVSVWDWDRFGRNQFLGEFRLALDSLDLTDTSDQWHILLDKDEDPEGEEFYRGQLKLSLRFSPTDTKKGKTRGNLQITIKQGRDLPNMGAGGQPDPVVKCYLLPDKSSGGKRKVGVIKNNSNPVWEEQISYKVTLEEIVKERVLEVTVWDWDKKGSSFIGGLRLGPPPNRSSHPKEWMDSIGEEMAHWETMLARPGEWVEQWHTLRTTMDPRNVALP